MPGEGPGHWPGAVCKAVAPRGPELELHLAGGVELCPLVRQRRAGDVAATLLQALAVVCFDPHGEGRSAQAMAETDALLWRLAPQGLERLELRSPEVALIVYRNLAIRLGGRLRSATAVRSASSPHSPPAQGSP